MSIFSLFMDSITKNKVNDWIPDFDMTEILSQRVYLKNMAKSTVLNFVARTMSTAEIQVTDKIDAEDWHYILNVRPNKDMSSADFWEKFFYRLLDDNEVLVIFTEDNQLLIAEDFTRTEYAVYEDTFDNILVKEFRFKKSFKMSEVIYLQYNNEELDKFTNGLFKDYGELFGRILEVAMRNNQIRGIVSIETTGSLSEKKDENGKTRSERLQNFVNKIYSSFSKNSVAIVPKTKGFEYEEYTNKQGVSNQSLDELNKMKSSLIDDIANAIGVPTALIYGEKADLDSNLKAFRQLCIVPLITKLCKELEAKILTKKEYMAGSRISVRKVLPKDILELATQIDKAVSSSAYLIDEIRYETDHNPLPNGEGQQRVRTKNYEEVKGGENNDAEN